MIFSRLRSLYDIYDKGGAKLFFGVILLFILCGWLFQTYVKNPLSKQTGTQTAVILPTSPTAADSAPPDARSVLPQTFLLSVPFTPQAPTANWDELHNEACEEASAIMAYAYFSHLTNAITLTPDVVEKELTKLTAWQQQTFGYNLDTTAAETATMIEQVYGLKTKILTHFRPQDLQTELAAGHLVAISESGRLLHNPYYKQPGPVHHMLLLTGYNNDKFITNDSGTKRGGGLEYDFPTIYKAAADWDHHTDTVDPNKKYAIVISAT